MVFELTQDEKEIQKMAIKQHRSLRSATEFRYGYKIVVMFYFSSPSFYSVICIFVLLRSSSSSVD